MQHGLINLFEDSISLASQKKLSFNFLVILEHCMHVCLSKSCRFITLFSVVFFGQMYLSGLVHFLRWSIEARTWSASCSLNLPTIWTALDALSLPATLFAVHVYWAVSASSASLISNEPLSWTVYLSSLVISSPSFVHVTVGVGTPLVGHWTVMFVLVSAVTLSPIDKVIGVRSWASVVDGLPGVLIAGLDGSTKWKIPRELTLALGSISVSRRHMWVEFVVGSRPCYEGFSPGSPVFLPSQKPTLRNSNSIGNPRATGLLVDYYVLRS